MDTSKHTVTIPISDYNELLKLKDEHSYMSTTISCIQTEVEYGLICAAVGDKNDYLNKIMNRCNNAKEPF